MGLKRWRAGISAAALIVLLLSLLPVLRLAPYTGPMADDFGYGAPVHNAVKDGLAVPGVLKAIGESIAFTYETWQGTFSSVFLFSIQPSAFSDQLYGLVPVLLLAVIIFPVFLALGAVPGMDRSGQVFLGSVISLLCVQYLPSPGEGIYWWNGAVHYLTFWGLGVVVFRAQTRLSAPRPRAGTTSYRWFRLVLACLGAFLIGGGNYSTALVFPLISLAWTVYATWSRKDRWVVAANFAVVASALAGLLLSVAAPGNSVRQGNYVPMGVAEAILRSFLCAARDIWTFTDGTVIGMVLLCIPAFLYATRNSQARYRCPLLILAGSFCAFAALYTPFLYAEGSECLPERMRNLIWIGYIFALFGNAFYLAGWAFRRLIWKDGKAVKVAAIIMCVLGVVVLGCSLSREWQESTSYLAWEDFTSGRVVGYCVEREERRNILEDKSRLSPRFQPISACPNSFLDARMVTWSSDLLIDGVPSDLTTYHTCGGEVTYVGLDRAMACFGETREWTTEDFSHTIHIGRTECVPLRELAERLGYTVGFDSLRDTVTIETG